MNRNSESTYTVIYASWVPTFLELNAVGFYFLLVKQVVFIYCECHINKILYHSMHLPITYHSICEKSIHIVRFPEDIHEGDIVVGLVRALDYRFKKLFRLIVDKPNAFDFNCKPLSDVNTIGFSPLYFKATERIILSGERLSKSSGNKEVSANS